MKVQRPEVFYQFARLIANNRDIVEWWDAACEEEKRRLAYYTDDFRVAQGRVQVMLEISELMHKTEQIN